MKKYGLIYVFIIGCIIYLIACNNNEKSGGFREVKIGKQVWMTQNLNVNVVPSHCYEDAELNCRRYGRLYTLE